MNQIIIRNEWPDDYRDVEILHRNAFWNLNVPGCNEHYLAHILRTHSDFVPDLDYVAELDGRVIANVMYTKSRLIDEHRGMKEILTFGPVSVAPDFQRKGIGKTLLEKTFDEAVKMGYKAIVIFGNPGNYLARGFRSCKRYNICLAGDVFPSAMLVKELEDGFLDGRKYYFQESPAFEIDNHLAEEFDKGFEPMKKAFQLSQEEFYIHSHSFIQ